MPEFKVTFTRHVIEWYTIYLEADSEQAVVDMYENGDLPEDNDPATEVTDEGDLKIELLPLDPDRLREEQQDQSRDAVLKLHDKVRVIPITKDTPEDNGNDMA